MRIKSDDIWAGIIQMGVGTILAQLINILAQPLLTRLFSPESLGIYTFILSLSTIVIPISSLKIDMLVVSDSNDEEAQYLTDACLIINIFISLVFLVIILVGYNVSRDNIFNKYNKLIFISPLIVLTNGLRFLFISYLNRYKKYRSISIVAILRELSRSIIQVGSGFLSLGPLSLLIGFAVSPLLGLKFQMKNYLKNLKNRNFITIDKFRDIIYKKGKNQIKYLVPGQFINSFSASLITIFMASLFSERVLGYYSAGVRILEIPLIFITSNVSKVSYQKISENIANNKPIFNIIKSVVLVLSIVSIVGFSILYFIAPSIASVVFGTGYNIAGEYIRYLCIMYAVRLVATSFNGTFTLFDRQKYDLVANLFLILVSVIAYFFTKFFNFSEIEFLWIINVGYSIIYIIILYNYLRLCKTHDESLKGDVNA